MMQIKGFIQSNIYDLYMLLLIGVTYTKYTNHLGNIYFVIMFFLIILMIFLKRNILYLIPIPLVVQMSFGDMRDNEDITIVFGSIIVLLLIFDIIKNRKIKKLGYLTIPLSLLLVAGTLTMVNGVSAYSNLVGWSQIVIVLIAYIYFLNTIDEKIPYDLLSKLMMYLSLLVTAQMVHFILIADIGIIEVIRSRSIQLGWENLNLVIYVNLVSIPLIGYLITKSKFKVYYMVLASMVVLGILLTLSRSSILSLGIYVVILVPLIIKYDNNKTQLLIQGFIFFLLLCIGLVFLENQQIVSKYMETLFDRALLKFDDRLLLLKIALESFLRHPIFGQGGIFASRYIIQETGNGAINYHNIIAQTATLGVLGLLALGYVFIQKIRMLLQATDYFKWFVLVLLIVTTMINSMLQPMYYHTSYMIFLFLVLAFVEVKSVEKDN